jgi:[acyl-carrier-protein] S-malonyltransferase
MVNYIGVFPGQGSQQPRMGLDLFQESDRVRSLFTLASDISHLPLYSLLEKGTLEEITPTRIAQLLITLINRASSIVLHERGYSPIAVAGFSLGELAAYREAGVISEEDLFSITAKRGQLMAQNAEIVKKEYGELAMAAIIGLSFDVVEQVIADSGEPYVYAANDNSTNQVVISGLRSSVEKIEVLVKALKARRVMYLNVSGPFHTPLMNEAKREFDSFLNSIDFSDPVIDLYSNVTGQLISSKKEIRRLCGEQIVSPVRWTAIMKDIETNYSGYRAIEVGYGKVLTALFKRSSISCYQGGTVEDINKIDEGLHYERVL